MGIREACSVGVSSMALTRSHSSCLISTPILSSNPCASARTHAYLKLQRCRTSIERTVKRQSGCGRPVRCLFRKKPEQEPLQPKLLLHEDIQLPFPASLLSGTFLAGRELRCCYKASRDGFEAARFHQRCDFTGPCIVVAASATGLRFGAFNPEGYRSTDDYYDTFDAFLFYWDSIECPDGSPVVLRKVGGSGAALFDYARGGPQFGADGLLIGPPKAPVMGGFAGPDTNSGGGDLREAKSRLGLSYALRPDGKDSLFGDDRVTTVVEVEVFCCPAIAALY